jgi:nitroreductase
MLIKSFIPFPLKVIYRKYIHLISLYTNYYYDFKRYQAYSATLGVNTSKKLEGKIIAHYHVLEKGFSFRDIKVGFSQPVVLDLINLLNEYYESSQAVDSPQVSRAMLLIKKYIDYHNDKNVEILKIEKNFEKIQLKHNNIINLANLNNAESCSRVSRKEYISSGKGDYESLILGRCSIRDFTDYKPTVEELSSVIELAKYAPSVCNRQSARCHVIVNDDIVQKCLSHQNGNRGFGHKIQALFIITSDLSLFEGAFERNQGFIDGGIFSMAILHALHFKGLGAVPLNWCSTQKQDQGFRSLNIIPKQENVILMLGIGLPAEEQKVPYSMRRHLDEVATFH